MVTLGQTTTGLNTDLRISESPIYVQLNICLDRAQSSTLLEPPEAGYILTRSVRLPTGSNSRNQCLEKVPRIMLDVGTLSLSIVALTFPDL